MAPRWLLHGHSVGTHNTAQVAAAATSRNHNTSRHWQQQHQQQQQHIQASKPGSHGSFIAIPQQLQRSRHWQVLHKLGNYTIVILSGCFAVTGSSQPLLSSLAAAQRGRLFHAHIEVGLGSKEQQQPQPLDLAQLQKLTNERLSNNDNLLVYIQYTK